MKHVRNFWVVRQYQQEHIYHASDHERERGSLASQRRGGNAAGTSLARSVFQPQVFDVPWFNSARHPETATAGGSLAK